ncbi:MAG: TIGR03088 family PEP-CTERM/XrtA system glycosyltransferase [Burkholderiales bacterium]|nr:TIGR03088 family PEP-CTERM/XrtA system glycosyltransferase [Burkholderiales bacterium]
MHAERALAPDHARTGTGAGAPLVAHVIYRLDVGGLENGVVNLVNRMPPERYRHAIVCLTGYSDFHRRIRRADVPLFSLEKPPGNSPVLHWKLWRLFRALRPAIVHSRNLAALEAQLPAALAGVPVRLHGEHGRDKDDPDGANPHRRRLRRLFRPFVHRYIAVSRDLAAYLENGVGVDPGRITQIYNGVDAELFHPAAGARESLALPGAADTGLFVIGTVGRMQDVKDQPTLARAFVALAREAGAHARRLRLVMVGDGPLRAEAHRVLAEAGLTDQAWLPGSRDDIPGVMRGLDLFVLPSLAEGISNTLLEAMASGLPVVATAVGGNPELVEDGMTGTLVAPGDPAAMARAMLAYFRDPALGRRHGGAGLAAVAARFRMEAMTAAYLRVYDEACAGAAGARHGRSRA